MEAPLTTLINVKKYAMMVLIFISMNVTQDLMFQDVLISVK